jgi:hypothetical protein
MLVWNCICDAALPDRCGQSIFTVSVRLASCFPTLFAKNAKRMGHPVPYTVLENAPNSMRADRKPSKLQELYPHAKNNYWKLSP